MTDSIFHEGGPHNIKRTGHDKFEMRISIPPDEDGMIGRECPVKNCSPAYFKVRPGTGITEGQTEAFCPYCRYRAEPSDFYTQAQKNYAIKIVENEAVKGFDQMLQNALGFGSSRRKKINGGLFSIEMSYTPPRPKLISRPLEEELRRDIRCPNCGLEHAVFGLATWCPDCGNDIFLIHVGQEFAVVSKMLAAVESRRIDLGARVAARDIENALEDTVSIFEAVLKAITRRILTAQGKTDAEIDNIFSKSIRNSFQNLTNATEVFKNYTEIELFVDVPETEIKSIKITFEKRHPITHNLGVIDRKYLERIRSGELEGREIRIDVSEVEQAIAFCIKALEDLYKRALTSISRDQER